MLSCLKDIREGKKTKVPVYDFITNSRVKNEFTDINPSDVVLIEGILVFYHSDIRTMFDMKVSRFNNSDKENVSELTQTMARQNGFS